MTDPNRRRPLDDLAATDRLARETAAHLPHGALLVLTGPLGAGKTTFVRSLAQALGSDADVTSPTYTLIHEYPTPTGPLVHIDAFRLGDATALARLGLDEYLERARAVVVEWGETLLGAYPDSLHLDLDRSSGRHGATWRRPPAPATTAGGPWHLGLDTATPGLALALWRPADALVHRRHKPLGRALAISLIAELDSFLADYGVAPGDLAAVGVGVGPGSFTGIRIGVAAALGLGRGLGIPVAGAGTVEAIASAGLADGEHGWACLDARKGAVYAGRFRRDGDAIVVLEAVRRRPREALATAERVVEGVAPDALHAARRALSGDPPHPRYE